MAAAGATSIGVNRFTPDPQPPKRIALCLSGGGFRAALFHLGALRRLNELGILHNVDTITSVSGGSTIAAFLAYRETIWNRPGGCSTDQWEREISAPFRKFTAKNFSTPSVLWGYPRPRSNAGVNSFARACTRELYPTDKPLPRKPNFQFCATELVNGVPCVFDVTNIGKPDVENVGKAVAISSAFPLIFWPYRQKRPFARFVDGGVADNRGIEPVWRTHDTLLVSDGGDVIRPGWSQSLTWALERSAGVIMGQMNEMQKRWLVALWQSQQRDGTFWSVGGAADNYPHDPVVHPTGYAADLALQCIAPIRLKYDAFTDAEAAILENHGYTLADMAIRAHARQLLPHHPRPLSVPRPHWLDNRLAREALRNSDSSSLGGHGWIRACWHAVGRNLEELFGGSRRHAPPAPPAPPPVTGVEVRT
jgi:NTE family protein